MRKQLFETVSKIIKDDKKSFLFLVDIGVYGFRDILLNNSDRVKNIGIFEDGMISVAAGMALGGLIPIIYGINPFIANRAYEQLKCDFAYQKLGGNFITTGAGYEFTTLGYTHYCPEDYGIIKLLPEFEFIAPTTSKQFHNLFNSTYNNGKPTYFRLTDYCSKLDVKVEFGKANIIKRGTQATVIAVSTMLDDVVEACKYLDVTILYYTTLKPFDREILQHNCESKKVIICEPHYSGLLLDEIVNTFKGNSVMIDCIGYDIEIYRSNGNYNDVKKHYDITVESIRERIGKLIRS